MSKKLKNQSRRDFLDKGIVAGAGLAIGLSVISQSRKETETIKMITLDGKLVEVESQHVFKRCAGPVSNKDLKKWIEEEKGNSKL